MIPPLRYSSWSGRGLGAATLLLGLGACSSPAVTPARDAASDGAPLDAGADDRSASDVSSLTDITAEAALDAGADDRSASDVPLPTDLTGTDLPTPDVPTDVPPDGSTDFPAAPDGGPTDVPGDVAPASGCAPFVPPARVDPCPGHVDCGLPAHARVTVTGARGALQEFQVQVSLPAAVRPAAGAACDRLVFRTATGAWAPHWVQDCAAGTVWVRVPDIAVAGTELTLYYGGAPGVPGVPAAGSYDDTFDRVPLAAAGLVGAWTFDEGAGTHTCPAAGAVAFDAFVHRTPYAMSHGEADPLPALWSDDTPPSTLAPSARFTRGGHSLSFPRVTLASGQPGRLINWQLTASAPFRLTDQITVGIWVYATSPAETFHDDWQTIVAYGMPAAPTPPFADADLSHNDIFNPWGMFFRGDDVAATYLFTNTCTYPCLQDDDYAHIITRVALDPFVGRWHFAAMTVDATATPHAARVSYWDDRVMTYPADLTHWPEETYCTGGTCRFPPDGPIGYYDAPVLLAADMNGGNPELGLEGRLDDLFIIHRAVPAAEMAAYRERRRYSPDPVTATVVLP